MYHRIFISLFLTLTGISLPAQNFKTDNLKRTAEVLGLHLVPDSVMPDTAVTVRAADGRMVSLRTDCMGRVEHIGIPLFSNAMRILQPSPVYDFLEYAVVNWKYKVTPNRLYLSKVIFKAGGWDALARLNAGECACSIENMDDKLYVVTWQKDGKDAVVLGIPIEYELLNNDTRRNMERTFVRELSLMPRDLQRPPAPAVGEDRLSIYGTGGLFVLSGKSYLADFLNQNVYYELSTVRETADSLKTDPSGRTVAERVVPVVAWDKEHHAESFANLMMCDNNAVPDAVMELDIHLSNYQHHKVEMPLSSLKAFCRQQGCSFFFAYNGVRDGKASGIMMVSNLPKGYNHLFSLRVDEDSLLTASPRVKADVYLYIPPIDKEKFFGKVPKKKSGANFKLP